jgi:hypothetical protein
MCRPSRIFFVFVCLLLAAPVWSQSPSGDPFAYVSTGTNVLGVSNIYSVDTKTGAPTLLVSTPNADYEGLVVLPDNTGTYPFLVYACDTAGGNVVRFNPAAATPITPETIYSRGAGLPQHPQCGRGTSSGDLIVTDTATGGGWWIFTGIASKALLSGANQTPTQLINTAPAGSVSEGTALKNIGDLLIVDNANDVVYRSPGPNYSTQLTFISSAAGLSNPQGIARKSDGQHIYVSNNPNTPLNNPNPPLIEHFDANGNAVAACKSLTFSGNHKAQTLGFMQMSPGDALFVAAAVTTTGGALFQVDASPSTGCLSFTNKITGLPRLVGVALALPNFSASQTVTAAAPGPVIANFGYAALEVTQTQGTGTHANPFCSVMVTATPTPTAFLTGKISGLISGSSPLPPGSLAPGTQGVADLGWDGFEIVLQADAINLTSCLSSTDNEFHFILANQVSQTVGSPQVVDCDDSFDNNTCEVDTKSVWVLGGILPRDNSVGGGKFTKSCQIFSVNSGAPVELGHFCGYESPLTNTSFGDPPATKSLGSALAVKFRLAFKDQLCTSTNSASFIGDATALVSLEQIADSSGTVFVPMGILSSGGSSPLEPIFKTDGNKNYTFSLNLSFCTPPSGVQAPCPSGTYALTTTFLGNNTGWPGSTDSIYTTQTTNFVIP